MASLDLELMLPPFLRDFHDRKEFFKAFYVWLTMRENASAPSLQISFMPKRTEMCNWMDFMILVITMLDFLAENGYEIQRTRKRWTSFPKIEETIRDLNELREAWSGLTDPIPGLQMRPSEIDRILAMWFNYEPYMPQPVRDAIAQRRQARAEADKEDGNG